MRYKPAVLALLTLTLAFSLAADERHQSYISYDDGGTIVRTDGRDVEAHRNLPIYPGDEIITARRGRAEVHLADGNILGVDSTTSLRFESILDSYEGDSNETVAVLRFGKVAVHRTDIGRQHVRLDTDSASYVATYEAVYSVETDTRGRDRITVFDGSVEVRTPARTTRLREGQAASVDNEGVFDLIGDQRAAADDFERWFLKRAERYGSYDDRYLDRRLSYWSDDLDTHGRWVFATGIGWSWRPQVAVGWRPYYHGYWYTSRTGCLTWVSRDPWGWAPYHYGRWAHDPGFGWVWVPGYSYSPAWVYWMYGSGYVGWAPAGWWDCHRSYYDWAYRPYRRAGYDIGFGFHGRIRVNDLDLRPWTFIDSGHIFTNRIDRAALTTDAIKQRLGRTGNGGLATVSGGASRFTREEMRDPAEAIRRRGLGGDTSGVTGVNQPDLTPFIAREANLGASVRDRIVRSRGADTIAGRVSTGEPSGASVRRGLASGGTPAGTVTQPTDTTSRRDPVRVIGRDRSTETPASSVGRERSTQTPAGAVGRDRRTETPAGVDRDSTSSGTSSWRDRVGSRRGSETPAVSAPAATPERTVVPRDNDSWRNVSRGSEPGDTTRRESPGRGSADVPARVIDRIGGARVVPRDSDGDRGSSRPRETTSPSRRRESDGGGSSTGSSTVRPRESSGSRDSGTRSSGGGGSVDRRDSGGGASRDSGGGGKSSSSDSSEGGNRGSGGKIKRDN